MSSEQKKSLNALYKKFLEIENEKPNFKILDKDSELVKFMKKGDAADRLKSEKWHNRIRSYTKNGMENMAKLLTRCDLETQSELKKFGKKKAATNGKDPDALTTGELILVALAGIFTLVFVVLNCMTILKNNITKRMWH